MTSDIEQAQANATSKEYLDGYPDFAAYVASDKELAIYHRFARLSTRNLLYLQSELLVLQARLEEIDEYEQGQDEDMDVMQAARCWETFAEKATENTRDGEKMKLVLQIRKLIKEYHKAVLLQQKMLDLQQPGRRATNTFLKWWQNKRPLIGRQNELFVDRADLITLKPATEEDRMSRFLRDHFGVFLRQAHDIPASWGPIHYFPEETISSIVTVISILLAAVLLIGAIASLYFVKAPNARLGMIAGFTSLFAASVGGLTNARKAEVFAATAA
ncbi:MAG: hypothetical protein M1833_000096 [Piccolia ochrophora]|nr:MAG: hypothetical protein M1833_000096 [Piccolia ochrophora]